MMPCHTFFSKAQPVAKACRYLFAKGSVTGCLLVLKEDVFFPKTVPYIIFSNGCWLHTSCHQRIYSTPFCFPNVCFSQAVCHNLFFKGCRQPFLQRLQATFFAKVVAYLSHICYLFSKGFILVGIFPNPFFQRSHLFSKGCHFCTSFNLLFS